MHRAPLTRENTPEKMALFGLKNGSPIRGIGKLGRCVVLILFFAVTSFLLYFHLYQNNTVIKKDDSTDTVHLKLQKDGDQMPTQRPAYIHVEIGKTLLKPRAKMSDSGHLPLLNSNSNSKMLAINPAQYYNKGYFSIGDKSQKHFNLGYFQASSGSVPKLIADWKTSETSQCSGNFVGYGREIAMLHDVILDPASATANKGGEDFTNLMKQGEDVEFFTYSNGFWSMKCSQKPSYTFNSNNHANKWMSNLMISSSLDTDDKSLVVKERFTIAILRYEYVNMYHTFTDFYNAFVTMAFFEKTQQETDILIVDAHPWGSLDPVWAVLFNSVQRSGHLPGKSLYKNLVWGMQGYNSPIFKHVGRTDVAPLALSEEFRTFFLSSYGLPVTNPLNCSSLVVTFVWRRNYVAHPRNPSGEVHRKIGNENELVQTVKSTFPSYVVQAEQFDKFDVGGQLKLISNTDIFIGMHGAALSLSLLMPKGRGMIELMPNYVNPSWKGHFIVMAHWRSLVYKRWVNTDSANEMPNHTTKVPPEVITDLIQQVANEMCKKR